MRWIAAWALLFAATPCMAQQTESITVSADSLLGVWKITNPHQIGKKGLFGEWTFGPLTDFFCRLERSDNDLKMPCLFAGEYDVTFNGDRIHLALGSMMVRVVIDGVMQPGTGYSGHAKVKLAGVGIEDPAVSSGRKLDLSVPPSDSGGMAQLLRDVVVRGVAGAAHDDKVKESPALRSDLGTLQAIIYLGQLDREAKHDQIDKAFYGVYALEFDKGERICGLHRRDDGVLDAFQCS